MKDIDDCKQIISLMAKCINNQYIAGKIVRDCKSGKSFFFGYDDCFIILKTRVVDGCGCVHIECAHSKRKDGFRIGYKFVVARAKEINARYITFSTANKGLEKMALRCGWAKLDQGDLLSSWIIEI